MPLVLEKLSKVYGTGVQAVKDLDLEVRDGEFFTLLGPSGCGKTTTLRMVAGLEQPASGRILIGGREITNVPPRHRNVAMVFQNYALYPHMSVYDNLTLNLQVRRVPRLEINNRVDEIARMLGLESVLKYKPGQLSGGQRQRVALGRALIRRPNIFLMDEPLSNLDLKLRERTRTELRKLHGELRITTIYVTHDQAEALVLSDRIGVMRDGNLLQVGTPREVYDYPTDVFVAKFIGSPSINLLRAQVNNVGDQFHLRIAGTSSDPIGLSLPISPSLAQVLDRSNGEVILGARPEAIALHRQAIPRALLLRVELVESMGAVNHVILRSEGAEAITWDQDPLVAIVGAHEEFPQESVVWVTTRPEHLPVFDPSTGRSLGFV